MIRFGRFPSKNCVRLTAEVERLAVYTCHWRYVRGHAGKLYLELQVGEAAWCSPDPTDDPTDEASVDAVKRGLLVQARRDLREAIAG